MDTASFLAKLGLRDRLMPPKYLLEKVGDQAQGIADDKPESSPYARPAEKFAAAQAAAKTRGKAQRASAPRQAEGKAN